MKIRIISDSCCDLRDNDYTFCEDVEYAYVPLTINFRDESFTDDKNTDVDKLLMKMKVSETIGKSACPNPQDFYDEMIKADICFCVTLSNKLSGSYNSAILAKNEILNVFPQKKVFVIDSLSASAGQILLVMKINELIAEKKYTPEQIEEKLIKFTKELKTRFLINDFTSFVKSGRMSKFAAILASVLIIKPICGDDGNGEIKIHQKIIGTKKAQSTMANIAGVESAGNRNNLVIITHCNNKDGAEAIKSKLETEYGLNNIFIFEMKALSSFYACNQGIVMATISQQS